MKLGKGVNELNVLVFKEKCFISGAYEMVNIVSYASIRSSYVSSASA